MNSHVWINNTDRTFRDKYGRHVIFHGTNIVVKPEPYLPTLGKFDPTWSLNDGDIDDLVDFGTNIVRLGVMWEAVEKEPHKFDQEYLDATNDIINRLGEKGIYTMIDSH